MKNQPFPDNVISAEDIIKPCIKSLKFTYKLIRKNKGKDIPYNGYNPTLDTHINLDPQTKLKNEMFEEYGDDPLESILGILYRLAFENGFKYNQQEVGKAKDFYDKLNNILNKEEE